MRSSVSEGWRAMVRLPLEATGLELRATASALVAKDGELLHVALLALATPAEVGKEHQRAPLLLNLPQKVALRASHKADGLRWHHDNGEVIVVRVLHDGHRANPLCHHTLNVLLGLLALLGRSPNLKRE